MQIIDGIRVNDSQYAIYSVLKNFGPLPDHALIPIAQHVLHTRQASSGIRTRRKELVDLGLARSTGKTKTAANRNATVFEVQ